MGSRCELRAAARISASLQPEDLIKSYLRSDMFLRKGMTMGQLIFRCVANGAEFESGFLAERGDLARISPTATLRAQCKICREIHEFKVCEGRVRE